VDCASDPIASQPCLPCRIGQVLNRGCGKEMQACLVVGQIRRAEIANGPSAAARSKRLGSSARTLGGRFKCRPRTAGQVELQAVIRHGASIAPLRPARKPENWTLCNVARRSLSYLSAAIASRSASRRASSVRDRTPSFA